MENNEPISEADSLFLEKQLKDWKARDVDNLLNVKMVTRPNSIMLAQAALETGWGSSRFFVHANLYTVTAPSKTSPATWYWYSFLWINGSVQE